MTCLMTFLPSYTACRGYFKIYAVLYLSFCSLRLGKDDNCISMVVEKNQWPDIVENLDTLVRTVMLVTYESEMENNCSALNVYTPPSLSVYSMVGTGE